MSRSVTPRSAPRSARPGRGRARWAVALVGAAVATVAPAAAVAASALPVGSGASPVGAPQGQDVAAPAARAATAVPTWCPEAPGRVAVVLVVDRGGAAPDVRCSTVAAGATGLDVLASAYGVGGIRADDPRRGPGFVCAIDGVPAAPQCADVGQPYWSYWTGRVAGWEYKQVGAASFRVSGSCLVEGWRFGPAAEPPRVDPSQLRCGSPPPPPPPAPGPGPTPPPASPVPPGAAPPAPPSGAAGPAVAGAALVAPPQPAGDAGGAPGRGTPPAGASGVPPVAGAAPDAGTPPDGPAAGAGTPSGAGPVDAAPGVAATDGAPGRSAIGGDPAAGDPAGDDLAGADLAGGGAAAGRPDGGSPVRGGPGPWTVAGVLALVALVGATAWRARARRRDEAVLP